METYLLDWVNLLLRWLYLIAGIAWIGASTYLIDRNVMALTPVAAVGLSICFLVIGWVVYDTLCRTLAPWLKFISMPNLCTTSGSWLRSRNIRSRLG